jgi:hypothetical protein
MANYMRPIFDSTGGQYGFSSIQVDPRKWDDSQAMVDEIIFWYESFREELKTKTPNITFKVPATPAAVAASEIICSEYAKIRLCATSCFSLKQQSEFYEVFKNRNPAGLLVIVDVHLRTFSKPEFEALGVKDVEKYCELLVSQIYSKSYQQLRQKGLDIQLNGAGIRDSQGVKNNLTSDMALPVTFTIMPEVVREFNKNKIDLVDSIISKASKEEMKILESSKIFKQAYYEDAFPWEEINSFPPYSFMMDAFIESYNKCLEAIKSFRDKEVTK